MATDIMNAHPDIKGFLGVCSTAGPGVAQAVQNAGKTGKVFTVGMGTPERHEEVSAERVGLGRRLVGREGAGLSDCLGRRAVRADKEFQPTQKVAECGLENVTYDPSTKILLMGKPLTFTKDNVGNYNF